MNILGFFRDWLANNEEKEKFRKAWISDKLSNFNWPENSKIHDADSAYEIFKLAKKFEVLEEKIEFIEEKLTGGEDGQTYQ